MGLALSKIKTVSAFAILALGINLGLPPDLSLAAQGSGMFSVSATLVASATLPPPKSFFCHTTPALAFGALVTVVCATGEIVSITAPDSKIPGMPIHGGAYRFILSNTFAPGLPEIYNGSVGYGMYSSWRVIQVADRDYYELLLGW